jgi:hypothetical protein
MDPILMALILLVFIILAVQVTKIDWTFQFTATESNWNWLCNGGECILAGAGDEIKSSNSPRIVYHLHFLPKPITRANPLCQSPETIDD